MKNKLKNQEDRPFFKNCNQKTISSDIMDWNKIITAIADGTVIKTYTSVKVRAFLLVLYLSVISGILFVIFSDIYIIEDPTTVYGMLTIAIFIYALHK